MGVKAKLVLATALAACALAARATVWIGSSEPPIVIGALTAKDLEEIPAQTEILLDRLRREIHPRQAALEYYDRRGLMHAIKNGSVRYVVADPVFFASIENTLGAKAVAGLVQSEAADADHMTAATVFVSARTNSRIRTLRDAAGSPGALLDGAGAGGRFALRAELNRLGISWKGYFASEMLTNGHPEKLVRRVLDEPGLVGVLPACALESLAANGSLDPRSVRVLSERNSGALACTHSTAEFPGWVLATLPGLSVDEVRRIVYVALSTEAIGELRWSFAPTSFANVHNALIDLHEGPYANTHDWVVIDVLRRYRNWAFGFIALVAAILLHSILAARLVRIRTRDLRLAMERQQRMSDDIIRARENLERIQRMHVVSQMSSILAHEIKQPLATIRNFALGLKMYAEEGAVDQGTLKETLDDIVSETGRAAQIVQRVRSYAKNQQTERTTVNLQQVAEKALRLITRSQQQPDMIRLEAPREPILVSANAWEIEIVVYNLLKNALEAVSKTVNPAIVLALSADEMTGTVRVTDNGPTISDSLFESLFKPLSSSKSDGLGLGLSICRNVAESHGGRITAVREPGRGLTIQVELPRVIEQEQES